MTLPSLERLRELRERQLFILRQHFGERADPSGAGGVMPMQHEEIVAMLDAGIAIHSMGGPGTPMVTLPAQAIEKARWALARVARYGTKIDDADVERCRAALAGLEGKQ